MSYELAYTIGFRPWEMPQPGRYSWQKAARMHRGRSHVSRLEDPPRAAFVFQSAEPVELILRSDENWYRRQRRPSLNLSTAR